MRIPVLVVLLICTLALSACGADDAADRAVRTTSCVGGVNVGPNDPPPSSAELQRLCEQQTTIDGRFRGPGAQVIAQTGCLACHRIGRLGNDGPGPDLSAIGARLPAAAIRRALVDPVAPMPSFRDLGPRKLDQIARSLSALRSEER